MDKKTLGKYLLFIVVLLAIGYGLGWLYSSSKADSKIKEANQKAANNVPGFDKDGKVIVYPVVNIISALVRESRVEQKMLVVEIASSTPSLAGTPLVRWVTLSPETTLNRAVRKDGNIELEKIKQVDLKPGDRVTIDASPNNIRLAKEFTAVSVSLDLPDLK